MKAINDTLQELMKMNEYELFNFINYYIEYFNMSVEPEEDWGNSLTDLFLKHNNIGSLPGFERRFCATAFGRIDDAFVRKVCNTIIMGEGDCPTCGGKLEHFETLKETPIRTHVLLRCDICAHEIEDWQYK